jgi:hypothetical protein
MLYLHPFAEEMNKSRRMAALQARATGDTRPCYDVLQIDLHGCGDSTGDFWPTPPGRLAGRCPGRLRLAARSAVTRRYGCGACAPACLVAVQAAALLQLRCNFLFWAPTPSGKLVWQQFMRLKAAGDLAGRSSQGDHGRLREALAASRTVEIAGYQVTAALARGLEQATLAPPAQDGPGPHGLARHDDTPRRGTDAGGRQGPEGMDGRRVHRRRTTG